MSMVLIDENLIVVFDRLLTSRGPQHWQMTHKRGQIISQKITNSNTTIREAIKEKIFTQVLETAKILVNEQLRRSIMKSKTTILIIRNLVKKLDISHRYTCLFQCAFPL